MELSIVNPSNPKEYICLAGTRVVGNAKGRFCGRIFVRTDDLPVCADCMSESLCCLRLYARVTCMFHLVSVWLLPQVMRDSRLCTVSQNIRVCSMIVTQSQDRNIRVTFKRRYMLYGSNNRLMLSQGRVSLFPDPIPIALRAEQVYGVRMVVLRESLLGGGPEEGLLSLGKQKS